MQNSTLSVQNYIAEAFGSLYTEGKSIRYSIAFRTIKRRKTMENILIIYKSKYGAAREYAQLLGKALNTAPVSIDQARSQMVASADTIHSVRRNLRLFHCRSFIFEEKFRPSQRKTGGGFCSGSFTLRPEDPGRFEEKAPFRLIRGNPPFLWPGCMERGDHDYKR